jgi:hypothetical protein
MTHALTNATFWWLSFPTTVLTPWVDPLSWMTIFASLAGLTAILIRCAELSFFLAAGASIITHLTIISIFGFDIVVMNCLVQVELLLLAWHYSEHRTRRALYTVPLYATCSLFLSSQWTWIILLALLCIVSWKQRQIFLTQQKSNTWTFFGTLGLFLAFSVTLQHYRPPLPTFGYPPSGRVVEDDGLPGMITPLIGETSEIPYLSETTLKSSLGSGTLIISLIFLGILLGGKPRYAPNRSVPLIATIAVLWSFLLPNALIEIGPIESAKRMLPGIFPLPTAPLMFSVWLCLGTLYAARNPRLLTLYIVGMSCVGMFFTPSSPRDTIKKLRIAAANSEHRTSILASPSLLLTSEKGFSAIERLKSLTNTTKISVRELKGTITSFQKASDTKIRKRLSDDNDETRWSPSRGAQYGDEWLRIELPTLSAIEGVELLTGRYFTDFPRGVRVEQCSDPNHPLVEIQNWKGSLELSTQGYPYYGSEHQCRVLFKETISTQCFIIRQIGTDPHFDWSVSELRLIVPSPSQETASLHLSHK